MLFTKELVSGRDINLKEHNLGIIKQLKVDDFMGEIDLIDFVKPFYLERYWRVNGVLDETNIPFTLFLFMSAKQEELMSQLVKYLKMLYDTDDINLVTLGEDDFKIIVKKKVDNKLQPVAFIDDSNFDFLCKVVTLILSYEDPKPEKKEEYEGANDETLALFEKYEKEYKEKRKKKDTIYFEEIVREVIHIRRCNYDDIKNLTVWQLQDAYKTYMYMDNNELEWNLVPSGYDVKKIKKWQDETKIMRD